MNSYQEALSKHDPSLACNEFNSGRPAAALDSAFQVDEQGLMGWYRALVRSKWLIVAMTLLGVLVGGTYSFVRRPLFQAHSAIEIQGLNDEFLNIKAVLPISDSKGFSDTSDIETQIRILTSDTLLRRTADKLARRAYVHEQRNGFSGGSSSTRIVDSFEYRLDLRHMRPHLIARPAGQTRVVELFYDDEDPVFAADVLNSLTSEYIQSNIEARWKMSQETGEWLSRQLDEMRANLERSDNRLQSYARETGLLITSEKTSVSEEKLRQLQAELSQAQSDRITKQSRWELVRSNSVDTLPEAAGASSLRSLLDKLAELRQERADLSTIYMDKHSKVQRIDAQIAAVESAIKNERSSLALRLRNDYDAAARRENLISAGYTAQLRVVSSDAEKAVNYDILKREVESNRQIYDAMLQRVKEGRVAAAMRSSNVRVIDAAWAPSIPYKPNLRLNTAIGSFSGFFFCAMWIIFRDTQDRAIRDPEDLTATVQAPHLGLIPSRNRPRLRGLRPQKCLPLSPSSAAPRVLGMGGSEWGALALAESFRSTVASILFAESARQRARVLVVTSVNAGDGKSTVAANLAMALATAGRKTLLIDGDMRKPHLHSLFGLPNLAGLSDVLCEPATPVLEVLTRTVHGSGTELLSVLTSGPAMNNASDLLHSPHVQQLIVAARQQWDMIVIDTPPVLPVADARILGRSADGVVMVVRSRKTSRDLLRTACDRLAEDGTNLLGIVLNDWQPTANRSYYGDAIYAATVVAPEDGVRQAR